jgi:hypothetical protein
MSAVRSLSAGISLLFASAAPAAGAGVSAAGSALEVNEIPYSRGLPHAFHDQAVVSLPLLYPDYQLLMSRRSGVAGEVEYALICFRETPSSRHGVMEAVAVFKERAWNLRRLTSPQCEEALVEFLGYIANLGTYPAGRR